MSKCKYRHHHHYPCFYEMEEHEGESLCNGGALAAAVTLAEETLLLRRTFLPFPGTRN